MKDAFETAGLLAGAAILCAGMGLIEEVKMLRVEIKRWQKIASDLSPS